MRVLGLVIQKNFLRFSVLDGTKTTPVLKDKGRVATTDPNDVPALMDWFETELSRLISTFNPDRVAYKLSLSPDKEQLHYLSFPFGVLNLLAKRHGFGIVEYSSMGITPSKLSLPKTTDLYSLVDTKFGQHPPYWNKEQKEAILVAWFSL